MTLYAGDRGPKAIRFPVSTGDVLGTDVASVRLKVTRPGGTEVEWTPSIGSPTASSVVLTYVLESDGSSVPVPGVYHVRAWLYDSGGALLFDSDTATFPVEPSRHTWPT